MARSQRQARAWSYEAQDQADAVIAVLRPLAENATLMWQWADPVIPEH